jgi:hypothetical protein
MEFAPSAVHSNPLWADEPWPVQGIPFSRGVTSNKALTTRVRPNKPTLVSSGPLDASRRCA